MPERNRSRTHDKGCSAPVSRAVAMPKTPPSPRVTPGHDVMHWAAPPACHAQHHQLRAMHSTGCVLCLALAAWLLAHSLVSTAPQRARAPSAVPDLIASPDSSTSLGHTVPIPAQQPQPSAPSLVSTRLNIKIDSAANATFQQHPVPSSPWLCKLTAALYPPARHQH